MSVTVTLYSFTKRENSTKQPSGSGTDYSCVMLDDTSLMNPTFKLSIASNPIGKNYAYVSDFNRYYFINDISTYQGFWYISCTCDVLASFKSEIGAESHYVLRAASESDGYISDTAYITKVDQTGQETTASVDGSTVETDPFAWGNGKHSYVLGIVGYSPDNSPASQIGSVTYYWLDDTELYAFITFLMNNLTTWSNIDANEYDLGLQAALLNPMQYITSAICLPFAKPSTLGVQDIRFGYYNYHIGGNVHIINHSNMVQIQTLLFSLPKHPQSSTRGAYLNGSPYTFYNLHLGPFGNIPLDPSCLIDETDLVVNIRTDRAKGISRIWVSGQSNQSNKIYTGTAQVGVPINLSQALRDALGAQTNLVNGIVDVVTKAFQGNFTAINSEVSALADGARLRYPQVIGGGDAGSFLAFHDDNGCKLEAKFFELVEENLAEVGRPLCKVKQISSLSGYILCIHADCQITGTQEEAIKINSYLNGGFFYE